MLGSIAHNPTLRIINRLTGHVCLKVEGEELEQLREQGALDMQELSSPEPSLIKAKIRQLFFYAAPKPLQPILKCRKQLTALITQARLP